MDSNILFQVRNFPFCLSSEFHVSLVDQIKNGKVKMMMQNVQKGRTGKRPSHDDFKLSHQCILISKLKGSLFSDCYPLAMLRRHLFLKLSTGNVKPHFTDLATNRIRGFPRCQARVITTTPTNNSAIMTRILFIPTLQNILTLLAAFTVSCSLAIC